MPMHLRGEFDDMGLTEGDEDGEGRSADYSGGDDHEHNNDNTDDDDTKNDDDNDYDEKDQDDDVAIGQIVNPTFVKRKLNKLKRSLKNLS